MLCGSDATRSSGGRWPSADRLLPGADWADLARAEREARLSARLNHPHVVSVFDFVADGDTDARWLVMEYVDGTTLGRSSSKAAGPSPPTTRPRCSGRPPTRWSPRTPRASCTGT